MFLLLVIIGLFYQIGVFCIEIGECNYILGNERDEYLTQFYGEYEKGEIINSCYFDVGNLHNYYNSSYIKIPEHIRFNKAIYANSIEIGFFKDLGYLIFKKYRSGTIIAKFVACDFADDKLFFGKEFDPKVVCLGPKDIGIISNSAPPGYCVLKNGQYSCRTGYRGSTRFQTPLCELNELNIPAQRSCTNLY